MRTTKHVRIDPGDKIVIGDPENPVAVISVHSPSRVAVAVSADPKIAIRKQSELDREARENLQTTGVGNRLQTQAVPG